jgi:hypothetical protein
MLDSFIFRSYTKFHPKWGKNVESDGINSFMRKVEYGFNCAAFHQTYCHATKFFEHKMYRFFPNPKDKRKTQGTFY